MVPSRTYLKFKETHSQKDLETLNSYIQRLREISDILNSEVDLGNETERKLWDEDEELTGKTLRLLFGDTFFTFINEYSLDEYDSYDNTVEDLIEDLYTHWEFNEA